MVEIVGGNISYVTKLFIYAGGLSLILLFILLWVIRFIISYFEIKVTV